MIRSAQYDKMRKKNIKILMIIGLNLVFILTNAQDKTKVFQLITNEVCLANWKGVHEIIANNRDSLKGTEYYPRILNIEADCMFNLGRLEKAIEISEEILKTEKLHIQKVKSERQINQSDLYSQICNQGKSWVQLYFYECKNTSKYRACFRLAEIEYKNKNYLNSISYLNQTDTKYKFQRRINSHGNWEEKTKALLYSKNYEALQDYERSVEPMFRFLLEEKLPNDTLASSRINYLYREYLGEEKLLQLKKKIIESLEIENKLVSDYEKSHDYSCGEIEIYKTTSVKESGRVLYTKIEGKRFEILRYNDVAEYERHLDLSRRKKNKWRPKSNKELLRIAKKELLRINIYKN